MKKNIVKPILGATLAVLTIATAPYTFNGIKENGGGRYVAIASGYSGAYIVTCGFCPDGVHNFTQGQVIMLKSNGREYHTNVSCVRYMHCLQVYYH